MIKRKPIASMLNYRTRSGPSVWLTLGFGNGTRSISSRWRRRADNPWASQSVVGHSFRPGDKRRRSEPAVDALGPPEPSGGRHVSKSAVSNRCRCCFRCGHSAPGWRGRAASRPTTEERRGPIGRANRPPATTHGRELRPESEIIFRRFVLTVSIGSGTGFEFGFARGGSINSLRAPSLMAKSSFGVRARRSRKLRS